MILKRKTKNKKENYIITFIKNLFSFLFLMQLILILFLSIWYFNNPVKNIYTPERLYKNFKVKAKNFVGIDIDNINKYPKIYITSIYYKLFKPKIDLIEINISSKNLINLEFQRKNRNLVNSGDLKIKKKLNEFFNAELKFNNSNDVYDIKLRVKGDRDIHFFDPQSTSYKIDVRGDKRIYGFEEFSLQKPIIRNYAYEFIFQKLNHELKNISLGYRLVDLSINDSHKGIYTIEEGFSKELIERNSRRDGPIFGIQDDISGIYPNIIYDGYSKSNWSKKNESLLESGYAILNKIKFGDEDITEYVDWESWAKFFATVDLSQAYHGSLAKSVRIYYNPVTGKIEPIPFDGHYGTADFSNFIILDFLDNNVSNCSWICEEREWFLRFLKDHNGEPRREFIDQYIKYLNLLSDNKFIEQFDKKYEEEIKNMNNLFYSDFSKYDNIFWKGLFPYIYDNNFLKNRGNKIRQILKSSNFSNYIFSLNEGELKIQFANNGMPIYLQPVCKNSINFENKVFIEKSKTILWSNNCKKVQIERLDGLTKVLKLNYNNSLSEKIPLNLSMFKPIDKLIKGKKINNIFLPSDKNIYINENTKVSEGMILSMSEGQKIFLSNSSTLAILGEVNFMGKKNNPNKIEGIQPGYGSIIAFNSVFKVKNLHLNSLIRPEIYSLVHYGGINIVNSKVDIENLEIFNSLSEDAINLINSRSKINNLYISNALSDAIDIDFGYLDLDQITCHDIGNDCLDFSNAKIMIKDINANGVQDKVVSIGEKSIVNISKVIASNSSIGIAVKDNSEAKVEKFSVNNLDLPVVVFVKKNEYGPASLIVDNLISKNSEETYLVDNKSNLIINDKIYKGTESGEIIESYLYGNIYGKSTVR